MGIPFRENLILWDEVKNLLVADVVLSLAFTLTLLGGIQSAIASPGLLVYLLPMMFIVVSLSFVLHELMHKFVAQRFGAIAAFKTSLTGLAITLISGFFGFLIGIPGATFIFTDKFTKRQNGIVSLAGPMTNFVVFAAAFAIGTLLYRGFLPNVLNSLNPTGPTFYSTPYLQNLLSITLFISILLAFFNMLPIFPLDGSKVLAWDGRIYLAVIAVIFALLLLIIPLISLIFSLILMLGLAYVFSAFSRGILLN